MSRDKTIIDEIMEEIKQFENSYDDDGIRKGAAPPLITRDENGNCGFVFGQRSPGERTTRYWLRNVMAIEIIRIRDFI